MNGEFDECEKFKKTGEKNPKTHDTAAKASIYIKTVCPLYAGENGGNALVGNGGSSAAHRGDYRVGSAQFVSAQRGCEWCGKSGGSQLFAERFSNRGEYNRRGGY